MKLMCKFSDIEQFRNIVYDIQHKAWYVGRDENDEPIYDESRPCPILTFKGTVKAHGTNAGVSINKNREMWAQSRTEILEGGKDNAGFAAFVRDNADAFWQLFDSLELSKYDKYDVITIFGEWCGGNIQKGVALNKLPKMFLIFDVKASYENVEKGNNVYFSDDEFCHLQDFDSGIFNIQNFPFYSITIDFNNPGASLEKLSELTQKVEDRCPIGWHRGVEGIGEGIVWTHESEDGTKLRFKTKGEKHSNTGPREKKIQVSMSPEKVESITKFVEYAVTEGRLNQAMQTVFGINGKPDMRKMGEFLKWVIDDIKKEESDVLAANGLELKEVSKQIPNVAKTWLVQKINESL